MSDSKAAEFAAAKQTFLRFAETVSKATSAQHLLSLLQADIDSPYHSFDLVHVAGGAESIGEKLCELMDEAIAETGMDK